jgi:hypothetical protein
VILPILFLGLLSSASFGQSWSNILSSSRAINWSKAGLPPTLPDGETTANPWTPPIRTQCGSTVNPSGNPTTDTTNINNALTECSAGHYVLLGSGTFTINSSIFITENGVTLRGSGPESTTITLSGNNIFIDLGEGSGGQTCTWSSGLGAGSATLGLTSCSGAPTINTVLFLQQCDSGFSGPGCTTGSSVDNGGLYICGDVAACMRGGEGAGEPLHQQQDVLVTGVTSLGGGSYTVTISPAIYMPNWSSSSTPTASFQTTYYGIGLEDLTVYTSSTLDSTTASAVFFNDNYGSWVKGVRWVGAAQTTDIILSSLKNCLFMNNYLHSRIIQDAVYPVAMQEAGDSDTLDINNIMDNSVGYEALGRDEGVVYAFNYPIFVFTNGETTNTMDHAAGNAFNLYEGNISGSFVEDDTHGTHDLSTWFRNYASGWYPPYGPSPNKQGFDIDSGNRFTNYVGNVLGSSYMVTYQMASWGTSGFNYVYGFDSNSSVYNDPLVLATSFRWANYDTVTGATRYCGSGASGFASAPCNSVSEVPTVLAGNAAALANIVPSSTNLPCSFFLQGFTSTSCTPIPNGGTGLSFWKVCTAWTTFPTTCASTQTTPFPPIGPDVTGGTATAASFGVAAGVAGHANDIPASIAYYYLPIDPTYQSSYTITSSSWSGGTETINISPAFPSVTHIMGGFQLTGSPAACNPSGGELFITNSSTTSVSYTLALNPGVACGGTMKFPDVRQFDERVYESDSGGGSGTQVVQPPPVVNATVQQ